MKIFQEIQSAQGTIGAGQLNTNASRPFIDKKGQSCVIVNGKKFVVNVPATLRYDEWKDIDRTVVAVATERLVGIADLISHGLTHNLGSVGRTISLWDKSSDMTPANVSMSGVTEGDQDRLAFESASVPVPIVHKDFIINLRNLEASRLAGEALDVLAPNVAGRVVAEKSEDLLFSTSTIQVDGGIIYGYLNNPQRNTVSLALVWDHATAVGADILDDVQQMLTAARDDNFHGPFMLYIPGEYETALDDDFDFTSADTRTTRERIMQLNGIMGIQVADRLANANVVLVQMTVDVVDLAMAQDITTIQWESKGGMQQNFKVMAVWVPRTKSDYDGKSGIVHLS